MKRNEQKLETSPAYHLYITYQIDPDTSSKRVELSHFAGFGNSVCVLRVRTIPILLVCSGSIQFYPILSNSSQSIFLNPFMFWFFLIPMYTMYDVRWSRPSWPWTCGAAAWSRPWMGPGCRCRRCRRSRRSIGVAQHMMHRHLWCTMITI
jgi:hypothetical protein